MLQRSPVKYLVCIVLLLATFTVGVFFAGISDMYAYNRVALNEEHTLSDVRFYIEQHIRREAVRLFASELPEQSSLPSFQFYSSEKSLAALNSNLPDSGKKQYIQAHLKIDKPELITQAKFRYRGNIPLHWLNRKKSLRIRLPDFTNYLGLQRFNLINPSTLETVTDWLSYEMSSEIGLLTPDYFPARVFINDEFNGLHFFLGQTDESLLRKTNRMPGNIYSGDNYALENPFGQNLGVNARVFIDDTSQSLMWTDHRLWEKSARRNAESGADRRDIRKFVAIVNLENPADFMREFATYFDADKYFKYWSLDTIVGSHHHDLYHNQKMYFDPYRGRFEPIQWDVRFWSSQQELPITPLLRQIKLNPILSYRLDQHTFSLLQQFSVEKILSRISEKDKIISRELAADPHRQRPSDAHKFELIQTVVPFFMDEYRSAISDLERAYVLQHKRISDQLNTSAAEYTVRKIDDHTLALTVAVAGNSPVEFSPWQLLPENLHPWISISKHGAGVAAGPGVNAATEVIYPGKKLVPRGSSGQGNEWVDIAFGNKELVNSPLHYRYDVSSSRTLAVSLPGKVSLRNAVTGEAVVLSRVERLAPDIDTDSTHPWQLDMKIDRARTAVILSGQVNIDKDLIFSENQSVTIMPGTTFRIAKAASIVFYGKVLAEGTAEHPIKFVQKTPGDPWGSIIIKGDESSGSRLRHIAVAGGSVSTQRLIDYPGEINIHEVKDFELDHCTIKDNQQGDDALHIAYSSGTVSNCHFENTAFDALDIDISDVNVVSSTFSDIGNDAIDVMSSRVGISNVTINNTGDKCLSIGENSVTEVRNSKLSGCLVGLAVKDQSSATLNNVHFDNNREIAIALYRKNPRYSGGGTISGQMLSGITERDIQIGEYSVSNIAANEFSSTIKSTARQASIPGPSQL